MTRYTKQVADDAKALEKVSVVVSRYLEGVGHRGENEVGRLD